MNAIPIAVPHRRAHLLAAAGLLHDAGKVLEPAGLALPADIENLQGMICPTDSAGRPTHRHVLYTAWALDQAASNFGGMDKQALFRAACYHHRPSSDQFDENLLTKADWIASGHDRRPATAAGDRVAGLSPVLETLVLPGATSRPGNSHVPTCQLVFTEEGFLPHGEQSFETYSRRCRELGQTLRSGLDTTFLDPAHCIESLMALTERVFHAIPASRSRQQQPDVTLFDHSRIVAAFAASLAVLYQDGPCDPRAIAGRYRLLTLALGSIQAFITRVVPPQDAEPGDTGEKGMARRLRARSFYVSLLSWLAARRILDATGLPAVNLMVDAGGRSMLLLPETATIREQLHNAVCYIERWFLQRLGGTLRLDLALSEPLDDAHFTQQHFAATFREADHRLGAARYRPPAADLCAEGGWAERNWIDDRPMLPIDGPEFHEQLRELGRHLPDARYITLDADDADRTLMRPLEILGYRVGLHANRPRTGRVFALRLDADGDPTVPLFIAATHLPRADENDLLRLRSGEADSESPGTDDAGAGAPGELLTFEQLAMLADDENARPVGHDMLAALKADVDRLGILLGYGLGERVSFGRFASVARSLDLFFKGFLNQQLETRFRHIYTVFAGGDDLFLIGPWYDLVRFLVPFRQWFARMTCDNPSITFSAGLVFSQPKTPISHLAHRAEEALEQAKQQGRNRITLGTNTLTWSQYERAMELHRLMVGVAGSGEEHRPGLNTSMLYRLLQYADSAMRGRSPADLKWRAQLSYDIKRNLPQPEAEDSPLARLHKALIGIQSAVEDAPVLHAAASLSLYFLRGAPA